MEYGVIYSKRKTISISIKKGNVIVKAPIGTDNKTIEELSKLEYLIGMRFHACLISAKARVKTLGINYDVKVQNLAKAVGFPSVKLDEKTLTGKFEELLNIDTSQYKIPEVKFPEI